MAQDTSHKRHGMDQILPWLFIADKDCSVIVNKDSSLLAAWSFNGVDVESGDLMCSEHASRLFDDALRAINQELPVVWTRIDRQKTIGYPSGDFTDPIAKQIDADWKLCVEGDRSNPLFQNQYHVAIAMPVKGGAMSIGELTRGYIDAGQGVVSAFMNALRGKFIGNQKRIGFASRQELDSLLRRFAQTICSPFENRDIGVTLNRLRGEDLMGFLKSTASASSIHPVAVDHHEYLDSYLSDTFVDNRYSEALILSGKKRKFVACFSLKKAPKDNAAQALSALLSLPVSLSVSSCFRAIPKADAIKFLMNARSFDELRSLEVKKMLRSLATQSGGIEYDDTPKTEVGEIAMRLKREIQQDRAYCGWLANSVLVYADTEAELTLSCDLVTRTLERSGLVFLQEREGNLSAFCVGIPGQLVEPVRWHFVESSNMTDMTPLVTIPSGLPYHPFFSEGLPANKRLPPNAVFRTRQNTAYNFNYHAGSGQLGHSLLIGPSRNGKTVVQMFLSSQFLKYPNARIFVIDKDLSCKPQTLLMGGTHLNLTPGVKGLRMNPVSVAAESAEGRVWLLSWLDELMSARGVELTDTDLQDVTRSIEVVADMPDARLTTIQNQLPNHLRDRLAPWCEGGAYGMFFDNEKDDFGITHFTTVEVGGLLSMGLNNVVTAFTQYAFFKIERALANRPIAEIGPTMIYFEEAGFLLDNEKFADKARDYLMTLAKKRAFLVMTAQSPEPFILHPKLGSAVRDNIATIIFMPNKQAMHPSLGEKYMQAFGVNRNHLNIIADALPRQEYCVFQPQSGEFRVISAKFPPSIIAALRSDARALAVFEKHYDPNSPVWVERYLKEMLVS